MVLDDFAATPGQRQADVERGRKLDLEAECPRVGVEKCGQALDRLNELERALFSRQLVPAAG